MARKANLKQEGNPLELGLHAGDLKRLAIESIRLFFQDKSYFCGGPIPNTLLFSDHSVKTVMRTSFERGFGYIHEHVIPNLPRDLDFHNYTVTWEVHCVLQLLSELKTMQLPKAFQPGLGLLYYRFCKGLRIPDPPKQIKTEALS